VAWLARRERMVVLVGGLALGAVAASVAVVSIGRFFAGVSPLRGAGLLRCASSRCQRPSVSPLTGCHPSRESSQAGDAG
jgi:hypothetical protein